MTADLKRVTLGNILSIVAMAATVFLAYVSLKEDMAVMKTDIAWIKRSILLKMDSEPSLTTAATLEAR